MSKHLKLAPLLVCGFMTGLAWADDVTIKPADNTSEAVQDVSEKDETATGDLAKLSTKALDPLAKLVSFPVFINNYRDLNDTGKNNTYLQIQPVIPFEVGKPDGWYGIARFILPVTDSELPHAEGLADTTAMLMFAKNINKKTRVAFGVTSVLPTHTKSALGKNAVGLGPAAGIVYTSSPWVVGILATQTWNVTHEDQEKNKINFLTLQPIMNYDFGKKGGFVFTSTPIISRDATKANDKWDIPLGGGVSYMKRFGKMPISFSPQAYYHVQGSPKWEFRFMVRAILPPLSH